MVGRETIPGYFAGRIMVNHSSRAMHDRHRYPAKGEWQWKRLGLNLDASFHFPQYAGFFVNCSYIVKEVISPTSAGTNRNKSHTKIRHRWRIFGCPQGSIVYMDKRGLRGRYIFQKVSPG